jgi:hypothetical protein
MGSSLPMPISLLGDGWPCSAGFAEKPRGCGNASVDSPKPARAAGESRRWRLGGCVPAPSPRRSRVKCDVHASLGRRHRRVGYAHVIAAARGRADDDLVRRRLGGCHGADRFDDRLGDLLPHRCVSTRLGQPRDPTSDDALFMNDDECFCISREEVCVCHFGAATLQWVCVGIRKGAAATGQTAYWWLL